MAYTIGRRAHEARPFHALLLLRRCAIEACCRWPLLRPHLFALVLCASCAALPSATPRVEAPAAPPRIGFLSASAPGQSFVEEPFRAGLRDVGYTEGQNIVVEYRYAAGQEGRARELALDLINHPVALIVSGAAPMTRILKELTADVPIVMAISGDPVSSGLVASLPRPGGNVTGVSMVDSQTAGKRLELLQELVPSRISRVGVLWNSNNADKRQEFRETQQAAQARGIEIDSMGVTTVEELDNEMASAPEPPIDGLVVLGDPFTTQHRASIVEWAARLRLPAVYQTVEFVEAGGLLAYGADRDAQVRRSATYVARILNGAHPSQLPVEQPTRFNLYIHQGTARALGIQIPRDLLLDATNVIQ